LSPRVVTPEYPTAQQRRASPASATGKPTAMDAALGLPKVASAAAGMDSSAPRFLNTVVSKRSFR